MQNLLEQHGAQAQKQPKYVPLFIDKEFTGLYTQRGVLHDPADLATAHFYGGRPDALWTGRNIELTNRLTLQRRPGLIPFSTAVYPTVPDSAFSFQLANGTIQVIIDTATTGALTLSAVANSSGGTAVYTGVFPAAAGSNGYIGLVFKVTGFTNTVNNGTYTVTASSTTTLTLSNATAVAQTQAGSAVSSGAVYIDNQNGTNTLLFAKSPGAGQAMFAGVAGILYIGDGVDTRKYTPGNTNGVLWNWGIVAPTQQPSVTIVESGAASVQWQANTVWSTMGLVYDTTTNSIQQLHSVNASTTNTTPFGTSGNGQPAWDQTPGGTTSDNSITWTNRGPVVAWTANTLYNNATVGGTVAAPCIIYDPITKSLYYNANPALKNGTSGSVYPNFKAGIGQFTNDGSIKWAYMSIPSNWIPSHVYPTLGSNANDAVSSVIEPLNVTNGLPTNQTVYWQTSNGGTSGTSGTSPTFSATPGVLTGGDGDLIWLSLGSDAWAATTVVSGWTAGGSVFSAIIDSNPIPNFQVCTTTGTTATVEPGTSFVLSAVANASGGNTVYTGTFSPTVPVGAGNLPVAISGFTNAANNGTFTIVSSTATTLTVNNPSGTAETHAGTAVYNPWNEGYGQTTQDGTAVWTCVGVAMKWATSTIWYLPSNGFSPPSSSSPYGGASIIDSNAGVEFIVNSGKGGSTAPTWNAIGFNTADGGTPLTLTQVAVSGGLATYTGTITGGGTNGLVGASYLIAGFTNVGNNILITVTASTGTTLVCKSTTQVNETYAGTATPGAIWYNLETFSSNSLKWQIGYVYAYSFKARSLTDYYSTPVNGALPIPPGNANALPAPTGSETNAISTASPVFTITGANAGAVNTIMGYGSTDPQVDTIVIWRSADGGGADEMFELTEIPAPPPIGGIAQPWTFKDYLPDLPTSVFPGLNELIPAPIDDSNNPPDSNFLPMVFNLQRIWGAEGQTVPFSGGPDVITGNPNEAFDPTDELPFLATVTRVTKNSQGMPVFLTDSVQMIAGGPSTDTFYSFELAADVGLLSYNELDTFAGEILFFSSDNQFYTLNPALNLSGIGFPIGDQLANLPSSGVSDATWNSSTGYIAVHQSGIDNCIMVADGATGWYRCNPRQVNSGTSSADGAGPVWSPFATITNGCRMVQSVEISPGIKKLLVGPTTGGSSISERSLTNFTDNGTQYDAFFVMGAIMLARPGQIALLKFIEMDFSGVQYKPTISYLLNELSGTFVPFTQLPLFEPPSLYGNTTHPTSYSPNRYYFTGQASLQRCKFLQLKVDFGTTSNADEVFNVTIFGRLFAEF